MIKQIYHPYWLWEDYKAGMWRKANSDEEDAFLIKAVEFTGNALLYGSWMLRVIDEWPIACEHNLTEMGQNRQAWIGHAACCLAINCPEYITRMAWARLSAEQHKEANDQADIAIARWESRYEERSDKIYAQGLLGF